MYRVSLWPDCLLLCGSPFLSSEWAKKWDFNTLPLMVPKKGEMAWCLPGEQEDQSYDPLSLRWVCWQACNSSFRRQGRPSLEEAACLDIKVNSVGEQIPVVSLWFAHAYIHSHTHVPICTWIDSLPGTYTLHIHEKRRRGGGAKALPINLTSSPRTFALLWKWIACC